MILRERRFMKGTRGAVMVEFLIAFMPIMTIYLSMIELSHYFVVREVFVHAANESARACAVIGEQNQPGGGPVNGPYASKTDNDAVEAAHYALQPWESPLKGAVNVRNVKIECTQEQTDPYGMDTAHITADYVCTVPIARFAACPGGVKKIDIQSSFPHQGAKYKM